MNGSIGSKIRNKSEHWSKHGKHGGMRGIAAWMNRVSDRVSRVRQQRDEKVDASKLVELFGRRK